MELEELKSIGKSIQDKLLTMVGSAQALETVLRFSPTDTDKLIRALRIFIDGGRRGISDASLGSTNLLYFALKTLEYEQLVMDGERDHTLFSDRRTGGTSASDSTAADLSELSANPRRDKNEQSPQTSTILMTTHSPHVASVTPLKDFVLLRLEQERRCY